MTPCGLLSVYPNLPFVGIGWCGKEWHTALKPSARIDIEGKHQSWDIVTAQPHQQHQETRRVRWHIHIMLITFSMYTLFKVWVHTTWHAGKYMRLHLSVTHFWIIYNSDVCGCFVLVGKILFLLMGNTVEMKM